jgi:hypothetical protein
MKIDNIVVGTIVICFAALLLVDAILMTNNPDMPARVPGEILSPNDVKGITGVVFGAIAVLIFIKAFVRTKQ